MRKILSSLLILTLTSACAVANEPAVSAVACKNIDVSVEFFSDGSLVSEYKAPVAVSSYDKHYYSSHRKAEFVDPDGSKGAIDTVYYNVYIKDSGRGYVYTVTIFEGVPSVFPPIAEGILNGALSPKDAQLLFNEASSHHDRYVDSTVYASFEYGESGKKVKTISDRHEVHITNTCKI